MKNLLLCWLTLGLCMQWACAQDAGKAVSSDAQLAMAIAQELDQQKWGAVYERFDKEMQAALPKETLAATWVNVGKQMGNLVAIAGTKSTKVEQYDVVFVTCDFQRGRLDLKLVFNSQEQISGLFLVSAGKYSPPEYARTDQVVTRDVTIGRGLLNLSGTLMLPLSASTSQPVPAVVLVHGSGPQDRDETIGPNKPFLDLAYGLSAQGIAVLRYEKRTRQFAAVMALQTKTLTVREETIDDAIEAFQLLKQQPDIDPSAVFILGHSLGGNLLPRIAQRAEDAAGLIGLAASARPLEDLILQQTEEILSHAEVDAEAKVELGKLKDQVARVKSPELTTETKPDLLPLSIPAAYWLDLRDYRPHEMARQLNTSLLLVQGGRDYQVTDEDWKLWQDALAGKTNVTLKHYPDLNHLMMTGQGRSQPAEYTRQGHVSQQLIDDLAQWIKANSTRR